MVKITLELTKHELELFSHCLELAIDVKPMSQQDKKTANLILKQLNKFILNPKV